MRHHLFSNIDFMFASLDSRSAHEYGSLTIFEHVNAAAEHEDRMKYEARGSECC